MKGKDMEKGLRDVKPRVNKGPSGRRSEYKPLTLEQLQAKEREKARIRYEKEKLKNCAEVIIRPAPPAKPSAEPAPDPFEVSPQRRAYLRSLPPLSEAEKAARIAAIRERAAKGEG